MPGPGCRGQSSVLSERKGGEGPAPQDLWGLCWGDDSDMLRRGLSAMREEGGPCHLQAPT